MDFPRELHERIPSNEGGAAAIEFALIATILFMLLFGILQFGQFYSQYQVLQGAAREGARFAATRPTSGDAVPTDEVRDRVVQAADPYEVTDSGAIAVSPECSSTTSSDPITVSWVQKFRINWFPFIPPINSDVTIKGVFRCE
jgi:Flp pilus assembly protein TadG